MQFREQTASDTPPVDLRGVKIPSDFLLSVTTAPLMLMLMGSKVLSDTLLDLSRSSEAVFQGDRLPVLHFPPRSPQEEDE